jgi:hypothetical protein
MTPDSEAIGVAVLVERRPANSPWQDWSWRAVAVLAEAPAAAPWTLLRESAGVALFLAGTARVELHPTDAENYAHNLAAAEPLVWVVLRPAEVAPGLALHVVTVDAGEAHHYADVGNDLLEALPLPDFLGQPLRDFVARHHRPRVQHKRRRNQAGGGVA